MKYIEIVGECELIYEGEPKEIAELQSLINPKVLTIKNDPLSNAAEHTKKIIDELIKENNNPKELHAIRLSQNKL
jgi:hypothetical protein